MNRWFDLAEEIAESSDYPRIKIGAVIVLGNYLVGSGFNQKKSHPRQAALNELVNREESNHYLHAEVHALIQSGRTDIRGADVYVARRDVTGALAYSRPCPSCWAGLKMAGVKRVYYTSPEGYFYEES